jgi:hypothetical protein
MATDLTTLISDFRLARLFSAEKSPCALQLWVLQIKTDLSISNRVVYGRLLPYSYANNSWSFSNNDKYFTVGEAVAKLTRLNLFLDSSKCEELLKSLSLGRTISSLNKLLKLRYPKGFDEKFGDVSLQAEELVYRPVAYLFNRDAHRRESFSSPHSTASAFSAALTHTHKKELFNLNGDYSKDLITLVVETLNNETGLNFGEVDASRFGELELLVFPSLNDKEQSLLQVEWGDNRDRLSVFFNPAQLPNFNAFQFHLSLENGGQVVSSTIASSNKNESGVFEYTFNIKEELRDITDSSELEIWGGTDALPHEGTLCCQWKVGYIREVNIQGHLVGQRKGAVKFDWLEKATRPAMSGRVRAALTVGCGDSGFGSRISKREGDPWVQANSELRSLFKITNPSKSDGQFFQRWSMGDGEGRLKFVEWFKALLAKYKKHQVVIFDPYFETAGLGLLLICAGAEANYTVFTSLPKVRVEEQEELEGQKGQDELNQGRIRNLLVSCEHNRYWLSRINLRLCGLKSGRLHDRYILIIDDEGLPTAGFHLSNSFQKAAENYPLLVTPIPPDVLFQVEEYQASLVQEMEAVESDDIELENAPLRLLFNSKGQTPAPPRYQKLLFLDNAEAGNVLGFWASEPCLKGISGSQLRARMSSLGLLSGDSLILEDGLFNCVNDQLLNEESFSLAWEVLSELLANSVAGIRASSAFKHQQKILNLMKGFLKLSFERNYDGDQKELATIDFQFFKESIDDLFHSSFRVDQLLYSTKYVALTWSEFYAIKILWGYAPDDLVTIFEEQALLLPNKPDEKDTMRLSLLSQVVSEVSISTELGINNVQLNSLVDSKNELLKWMGFNVIESQLYETGVISFLQTLISAFTSFERVRLLGWMVYRASGDSNKQKVYKDLIAALHDELPSSLSLGQLKDLVDTMRGHMHRLAWAEPWLFQDVISPLLRTDRINFEDASKIWMLELLDMLGGTSNKASRLFDRAREGQTTNIAAFLFANSESNQRKVCIGALQGVLKIQKRIIQQPLASTSNWTQWDDALRVSLWILAFCKWGQIYLDQRGVDDQGLVSLIAEAESLSMIRPRDEWRYEGGGRYIETYAFLEQAESILKKSKKLN